MPPTEYSGRCSDGNWWAVAADLTSAIRRRPDDEAAWDAWFREIYPRVVYMAAAWGRAQIDEAEEAAQGAVERFLRYRAYERVDSDRSAVLYLVRTAVRLMTDIRRLREREVPLSREGPIEERSGPDYEDLDGLLRFASEEDRQVLQLVVEGHSVGEIASLLEVGYSAAGMRIHRARKRLRERLESEESGPGTV